MQQEISLFETNIRVVGGLLSAYDLSGDKVRADDLARMVMRGMILYD